MDIDRCIDILSGLDLFKGFTKTDLHQIFRSSKYRMQEYEKGQIIHLQNEICTSMDIILDGRVSVQKIDSEGNVLKITDFFGGDTLGANLIFSHRNSYPLTVAAASRTTALHMYKDLILELSQSNVSFLTGLMTVISDRTLVLTDKIDAISLKSIRQCIIDFLKYEQHHQNSSTIIMEVTKKELAERLGIQRTSLSRELNKMRREGLVEYNAGTITINNPCIF